MTGPTLELGYGASVSEAYGAVVLRKGGSGSEVGSARSGAVLFARLSERRIYTIGENKSRAGYLCPQLWRGNPLAT